MKDDHACHRCGRSLMDCRCMQDDAAELNRQRSTAPPCRACRGTGIVGVGENGKPVTCAMCQHVHVERPGSAEASGPCPECEWSAPSACPKHRPAAAPKAGKATESQAKYASADEATAAALTLIGERMRDRHRPMMAVSLTDGSVVEVTLYAPGELPSDLRRNDARLHPFEDGPGGDPRSDDDPPLGCQINPIMSCVCDRGTPSCVLRHGRPDVRLATPAAEHAARQEYGDGAPCPTCGQRPSTATTVDSANDAGFESGLREVLNAVAFARRGDLSAFNRGFNAGLDEIAGFCERSLPGRERDRTSMEGSGAPGVSNTTGPAAPSSETARNATQDSVRVTSNTETVRAACRRRQPLDGTDAEGLEHALTITERERDQWKVMAERLANAPALQGPSSPRPCANCWDGTRSIGCRQCQPDADSSGQTDRTHAAKSWRLHLHNFLADHLDVRMTDDDIEALAGDIEHWEKLRAGGLCATDRARAFVGRLLTPYPDDMLRDVTAMLAAERRETVDACAKVVEMVIEREKNHEGLKLWPMRECVARIRALAADGSGQSKGGSDAGS